MLRFKAVFSVFVVLLLAGCAPGNVSSLKNSPGIKESFTVQRNYQAVYRDVSRNMREEYTFSCIVGCQAMVNSDLYSDIEKGVVTHSVSGTFGPMMASHTEISRIDENHSAVNVYISASRNKKALNNIKRWAEGF